MIPFPEFKSGSEQIAEAIHRLCDILETNFSKPRENELIQKGKDDLKKKIDKAYHKGNTARERLGMILAALKE